MEAIDIKWDEKFSSQSVEQHDKCEMTKIAKKELREEVSQGTKENLVKGLNA